MGMPRRRNRRHGKVHRNKCWYHRKEEQDSRLIPPRSCPTDRVHLSPLLHHHPTAQKPAESHRGDTRGGCRAGTAHRPAGEADARFPSGPIRQLQLSRLHHRPGRGYPGAGGRPSPPRRGLRMPSETSSTAWDSIISRQAVSPPTQPGWPSRCWRISGPLGGAHRSGRATGDHQDPAATLLLYGRTAHPLGAPDHPASSQALAVGGEVQLRPGPAASHSTPSLTAPVRH